MAFHADLLLSRCLLRYHDDAADTLAAAATLIRRLRRPLCLRRRYAFR